MLNAIKALFKKKPEPVVEAPKPVAKKAPAKPATKPAAKAPSVATAKKTTPKK